MKILMMTNTYFPIMGGLEKSIRSFTSEFQKMDHEVLIVMPELGINKSEEPNVIEIPSIQGVSQMDFSVALPFPELIEKNLSHFHPDIIHAHHPFLMGEMAVRAAAKYSCPLIYTHHIMLDQYEHYLPLPPSVAKPFLTELGAGFANLASRVIAPSESVRGILRAEGVLSPIDVVPTGIDAAFFRSGDSRKIRARFEIPQEALVLGYAGRLAEEKNLDFLSRAVISFLKKWPAFFLIAGTGPVSENLRRIFSQAGVLKRVIFTGALADKALADFYASLDYFVFSSKTETQGLVVCEAMAAGVPVIALDGPGVREVVKDFENGRLVATEKTDAFSEAIQSCAELGPEKRNEWKESARRTAESFSLNSCARRAIQVYETAVQHNQQTPFSEKNSAWHQTVERLKTEWRLLSNLSRATGRALSGAVTEIAKNQR